MHIIRSILLVITLLAVFSLAAFATSPAQAAPVLPVSRGCAAGFELHHFMEHHEHGHHHIGLTVDLNKDGMICVRHVGGNLHVHVDNVAP